MTGRPPVDGQELMQLLAEATDPARRPTPRARGATVTDAVEAVFARALSVDPRARQAHIEQMWEALTKAAAEASRFGTAAIQSVQPSIPHQAPAPRLPTALMAASSPRAASPAAASVAAPSGSPLLTPSPVAYGRPVSPSLATPPPVVVTPPATGPVRQVLPTAPMQAVPVPSPPMPTPPPQPAWGAHHASQPGPYGAPATGYGPPPAPWVPPPVPVQASGGSSVTVIILITVGVSLFFLLFVVMLLLR
jgi:hypothetical protein